MDSSLLSSRLTVLLTVLAASMTGAVVPANEATLAQAFEGKQVVVRMDMPGTQQGVDLFVQRPQPLDTKSYAGRLKKFGTSIRNGDTVMVTKIKVKDKNIEFQLAGGGYGTAGDDTDTSVHYTPIDKSSREKDLEQQIRDEKDPDRRRALQRQLDDVRSRRERQDRRDQAMAQDAAENKKQLVYGRRQQGGSRFNLRFNTNEAAASATPEQLMTVLASYVSFASMPPPAEQAPQAPSPGPAGGPPPPSSAPADASSLKKGMSIEEVKGLFGEPTATQDRSHDGMKVTAYTFVTRDSKIDTNFVNGVLVQYTVSSR
jgi:hypothetical protein